jgi:hypothetical protein
MTTPRIAWYGIYGAYESVDGPIVTRMGMYLYGPFACWEHADDFARALHEEGGDPHLGA